MIENGVPAERLSVVGLASNQPLVPNDSPENRAKNRRVTITIVAPKVDLTGAAEYSAGGASGDAAAGKP
jgi:chemotaxis protein MotB